MAWTAPRTWVAGETVTAAMLNTHLRDNLKAIGDAWASFTPTLSGGWALGNGTLTGAYSAAGKMVVGRIVYTIGSTDTKSGVIGFLLPVNAKSGTTELAVGTVGIWDTSASSRFSRVAFLASTSQIQIEDEAGARVTHLVPVTFATGDQILISFQYEAA